MKIKVTFKTPDVIDDAVRDIEDEDERAEVADYLKRWIEYGEYITIEFDTIHDTAEVQL